MSTQARPEQDDAFAVEMMAVKLLAGREHSRQELRRKLQGRGFDAELVEAVLDDLQRRDMVSDRRFAESYIDQRFRKGYGPLRIRAELSERGIDADIASTGLGDDTHDWAGLLTEVALRKFGELPAVDRRALAKRGRFLEQRGFPASLVRRYLDRVRGF